MSGIPAGHNSFIYLLKGELKVGEKKSQKNGRFYFSLTRAWH